MGVMLSTIVFAAILGNILVVLSVCTNKRLRTVTNFYVVSLALSDLCVALLVMPIAIVVEITGKWYFGYIVCELWVSCDVMLCTASILNLCCISLDRYFAITKPLVYATKRSKRLALYMIAVVWVSAVVITCPPIFGWREEDRRVDDYCHLTKAPGYIIYSSLGSFYVPLLVMIFVYIRIFIVACRRERRFRPYCHHRSIRSKDHSHCSNSSNSTSRQDSDRCDLNRMDRPDGNKDQIEMSEIEESGSSDVPYGGLGQTNRGSVSGGDAIEGMRPNKKHVVGNVSSAFSKDRKARGKQGRPNIRGNKAPRSTVHANRNAFLKHQGHLSIHLDDGTYNKLKHTNSLRHHHRLFREGSSNSMGRRSSKMYGSYAVSAKSERFLLLKEHKAAKTLAVVVGGFIACWLPFFLMYLIEPFCKTCNINPTMATFFVWLGYFNSVINPFIYALYNNDFRHTFWSLTIGLLYTGKSPCRGNTGHGRSSRQTD